MAEANLVRPFDDEDLDRDEVSVDPEDSNVSERAPRAPSLRRLGRYRLVREIATGGMASVNLAVTEGLDKLVALKMIHPHLAQEQAFVRMFLDEARIASSISHRNVCNTFDFGEAEGRYYIAMDYLAGQSLRDLVIRLRKNPAEAEPKRLCAYMAYIMAEACEGLHAAHELKDTQGKLLDVVHRDVSPHNLFVTYDGNVSVVDFGIARASDRLQHTATGVLKGKFSYMAPEQVRQLEVDRRADIWSLGVCLWEAITLERLFVRSSQADTLMSVMMDRVRPPSEVRPEIPKALDAICGKALSRSAAQRYTTAREMGRDLMQVVRESGVMVGPVEIEQWLERLFARERENSRSLTRYAKQSALDDSQTWADGSPASIAHAPTRSGLVPRLSIPGASSFAPYGESASSFGGHASDEMSGSNLERLLAQPLPSSPARPLWQRGVMLGSLVGFGALLGVAFVMFGRSESAESRAHVDLTTPEAVIVDAPPPAPAAVAPKSEPVPVAPIAAQPAVEAEDEPTEVMRLSGEPRSSRSERRRAEKDVSRSAPAERAKEPIPEATKPKEPEAVQAVPTVVAAATTPSPSVPPAAPVVPAPASALRDAPTTSPAPVSAAAPLPVAPKPAQKLGAKADIGDVDVEGSLGSGIVSRMLGRATPLLESCYLEAAQKAQKNDFSAVKVSLSIDEMGAVRSVETGSHPLPGMARCTGDALKRLRSERKPDVGTVRVKLAVTLRPR